MLNIGLNKKRNKLVIAGLLCSAISLFQSQDVIAKTLPNIIVIMADDLGVGDVSFEGAKDVKTPHIDSIAQDGLTFKQFYANSTVCSPSRAAFLTGKFPDLAGVPGVIRQNKENNWGYLDPNSKTVAEELSESGYQTALVGKWHLGLEAPNTPNGRGFEHFHGFLGDMMDDYWTHLRGGINWMRLNDQEIKPTGHATDLFTEWANDYIAQSSKQEKPFFLFLAYNAPHFPIQPPKSYLEAVKKRAPELSKKRANNVAFVEHLDDAVGSVLSQIEKSGISDNTLVIFTSDNGGALNYAQSNGDLRGGKQDMYEGGIRIPTYVRWPEQVRPHSSTNQVALLSDLMPTFLDIAGKDTPKSVDGESLLPVFSQPTQSLSDRTLFWMRKEGHKYSGLTYYAARKGDKKLVQNSPFEPLQFFDLSNDPYEEKPLPFGSDPVFKQLRSELMVHIQKSGRIFWQQPAEEEIK